MLRRCSILILSLLFVCCEPKPELKFEQTDNNVSIAYLKSLYRGYPVTIDKDFVISGRLVSTDQQKNFYKTLVLEDKTGGIEVKVDAEKLYLCGYVRGNHYSVRCNALTLGAYGGSLQIGVPSADPRYQVDPIPESRINSHIKQLDAETTEVEIPILTIGVLTPSHINRVVSLGRVQFADEDLDLTWSDESLPSARHLVDTNEDTIDVYTRPEAIFASKLLPQGSGYIEGIVGYFNGRYQIRMPFYHADAMRDPRF